MREIGRVTVRLLEGGELDVQSNAPNPLAVLSLLADAQVAVLRQIGRQQAATGIEVANAEQTKELVGG